MRTPRLLILGLILSALVAVAACGTTVSTSPSPAPTSSLGAALPGQTETEWGPIWDTLPGDFPRYPNSMQAGETAQIPASGTFVVDGDDAATVASWFEEALVGGPSDDADIEGPLEDGGYIVHVTDAGGCQVQVSASPLGSLTSITILYGGECPNP